MFSCSSCCCFEICMLVQNCPCFYSSWPLVLERYFRLRFPGVLTEDIYKINPRVIFSIIIMDFYYMTLTPRNPP
ncbi:hypothetical protein I7I53_09271 [Histoplasma capsulatum var. duboisii H88]|uniref:Uncharacterized protein n=1 Tax=Ajellomyces capsulatus (strain H88) TaxID=544711 RepID=A0A8A1L9A4_AJEC8|nr:hypothetical protein I7I53_09271 [Histoplasma capsulatum var. duboisii H88]